MAWLIPLAAANTSRICRLLVMRTENGP